VDWGATGREQGGAARPVSFLGPLFFSRQFRAEEEKGAIIIRDALYSYYYVQDVMCWQGSRSLMERPKFTFHVW
jgi:hypothetical protein